MMLRVLQIYLLLNTITAIFAKCILEGSTSYRNDNTITCTNTSTEDYVYSLLQLFSTTFEYSPFRFALRIRNSNFSAATPLVNPRFPLSVTDQNFYTRFSLLSLNFCDLKTIANDKFTEFPELEELDLGFNEIEDLSFVSDLPGAVSTLNLTRNRIEYVDFGLFRQPLAELDLSFNKIMYFDLSIVDPFKYFPVQHHLALNNNNITEIRLGYWRGHSKEGLELNLAYNNLNSFKNTEQINILEPEQSFRLENINLDHSIANVNILKDIMSYFAPLKLVLANNELHALDKDGIFMSCKQVDFSNCSLSSIHDTIFQYSIFDSLNFSHNDLRSLNDSLFHQSRIETIDLSYNKIRTIKKVFQQATVSYLNLSHNRISKLGPESFKNLKGMHWLDLSFNNLISLGNSEFVNCRELSFLNLASNNLSNIADQAFEGLNVSGILNLENNSLRNLSINAFKSLKVAADINLRNNRITTIQSHLFDSIPVRSIILSENRIESIHAEAFHNLTGLRGITIDDNFCPMSIERNAFSELRRVGLISLKNSNIDNISSDIFFNVNSLHILDIRDNNVTFMNFSSHTNYISIDEIRLTFNGDIESETFLKPIFVRELSFSNSDIRNIANKSFQGLFHLDRLNLINTTIGRLENDSFSGLFALRYFTDRAFMKGQRLLNKYIFKDFHNLGNLNLSNIRLEQIMPLTFAGMKHLKTLYLDHNKINVLHKAVFTGLNRLEVLDLSHNELTILKRDDFLGLSGLMSLNVSNNNISDVELGSLQSFLYLDELYMANNKLTEFKIGAFSKLYYLKRLDISQNRISSLLFESFLPLKYLEYLNLEFNNLKTIQHISLVSNLKFLKRIRIAKNKWKCDFLSEILVTFKNHSIDYSTEHLTVFEDNIESIHCIDVCKYLYCLQDTHGIN